MPVEKCDKRITKIVKETDILILGSGLAGLGAAYELKSNKLNYIVLEAQSVPGGRIRSQLMHNSKVICNDKDPKNIVNSGAQWLHGRENLLYKIADEYDLLHSELSEEGLGTYIRNDGFRINDFLVKKVDFIVGQILEECEELTHNSSSEYPPSVGTYLITEFEKRLHLFQSDDDKNIAKQLLDWHIRFQIIDNSCSSVDQISAKSWGSYSFNGESCQAHINFKKSFYDIVDELVDKIGPKNIVLNTEVETIYWSGQFYIPTNNPSDDPKVFVKCKNGDIYIAKTAICTFSLGVLKASIDSLFYPKLPKRYQDAITKLGFGTINKIFLRFENSWWNTSKGFQLIYEFSDYKNTHWTRFISGFDVMHPGPPNTLLGWVGGAGAIMMETFTDETIVSDCLEILTKFTSSQIPNPISYYITRWHSNKYIKGAYSYCSNKCDMENITPKNLAIPIYFNDLALSNLSNVHSDSAKEKRPLLLFAGEACHDKYYSTAHGAFLSGCEQAHKLFM